MNILEFIFLLLLVSKLSSHLLDYRIHILYLCIFGYQCHRLGQDKHFCSDCYHDRLAFGLSRKKIRLPPENKYLSLSDHDFVSIFGTECSHNIIQDAVFHSTNYVRINIGLKILSNQACRNGIVSPIFKITKRFDS